jgi:Zn-dependent peptidase ImmA (M78 family)
MTYRIPAMARTIHVPINGEVLTWAMQEAGVSDLELSERCKTTLDVVEAWRDGDEKPTKTQFNLLVARLRRPASVYFLARPPEADPVIRAFRKPPGAKDDRELLDAERRAVQSAERLQKVARWVREQREDAAVAIPRIPSPPNKRENSLSAAHRFLKWRVADQFAASSASESARLLRRRLELVGILVVQLPMTKDGCRGFSLYDKLAPVIVVNSAYTTEARIFSYMHEYAHLARGAGSICQRVPDSELELRCERFASAFLMPKKAMEAFLDQTFGPDETITSTSQVAKVAKRFKVSLRAAAFRIDRIERAASGLYGRVDAEADFKGKGGFSKDNEAPAVRLREWGAGYAELLLDAERRGLLGRTDLLEYFNLSNRQLGELRSRVETGTSAEG